MIFVKSHDETRGINPRAVTCWVYSQAPGPSPTMEVWLINHPGKVTLTGSDAVNLWIALKCMSMSARDLSIGEARFNEEPWIKE